MTNPAPAEALRDALNQYDAIADAIGSCGDGGCVVKRQTGQHTNGGCRCAWDRRKSPRMMAAGNHLAKAVRAYIALATPVPPDVSGVAERLRKIADNLDALGGHFCKTVGPDLSPAQDVTEAAEACRDTATLLLSLASERDKRLALTKRQAKEVHDALIFWQAHDCRKLSHAELDDIIISVEDIAKPRRARSLTPKAAE